MPNPRRIVAAGAIGNVLEWYDFAVYGYFAAAIGRAFFPSEDPVAQVLAAFGVFAIGFFMRPVGGALVGYIGDRLGRSAALTFSVAAMAIPTFLVGILPGHETLGIAAPILLTLLRMVQGLSVGGEYTTSVVFMVEHAPPKRRGLVGAVGVCGAAVGILGGSATGAALAAVMSDADLENWGWRIPFILGLVVGLAGFVLRRGIEETPPSRKATRSPIMEVFLNHRPVLLRVMALSLFNGIGFYLAFVYLVSWLQLVDGVAPAHALGINTVTMALLPLVMLSSGWLSDRIGRRPVMLAAAVVAVVAAWPLLRLMHSPDPAIELLGQLGIMAFVGVYIGCQPTFMVESAPASVRCSLIAIGFNVTVGFAGGLTPLVATWLVERTANDYSPAFLVMAAAAVAIPAVLSLKETAKAPLDQA